MTKVRPPLSYENALSKVAGTIGWITAAEIVGKAENTVRNWSDPDTSACITLDKAEALDLAYRVAGGDGYPFFQCYMTRLNAAAVDALASREALIRSAATAAEEGGQATAAILTASLPGATDADFVVAERELEQAIAADTNTLATLRAVRRGEVQTPGGE